MQYHDYYKYRISYITEKDLNLMFLFVTGLTDNFENIKKELVRCKKEFMSLFEDILDHKVDAKTFEVFDPTIDSIHRNLRPKISLVGFSGVGKTTITRLIKAEEIPMQHVPTITGDIATIKIGKLHFHLWDFAGQEQFSYLWTNFVKGSDAVLLITDSTLENVEKSKFFLELIKNDAQHAHTAVIGNKQDLPDALKPEQIERILGLKTYSMIAKEIGNRDKMITIIADILEMSAEVSPLLKPLLERDELTEQAAKSLEEADFEKAVLLFEKISDLCIELGDDSLGREFYEKAAKIREMLSKVGVVPVPPKPAEAEKVIVEEKLPATINIPDTNVEASSGPPVSAPPGPPSGPPVSAPPGPPPGLLIEVPPMEAPKSAPPGPALAPDLKKPVVPKIKINLPAKIQPKDKPLEDMEDDKMILKPKFNTDKLGLKLDPKDFMIKQRPKTITAVPKDAKDKLKMSPHGHVENPSQPIQTAAPVSPTQLIKPKMPTAPAINIQPKAPVAPVIPSKPREPVPSIPAETNPNIEPSVSISAPTAPAMNIDAPPPSGNPLQALQKSVTELQIKKANIANMILDFEMKEVMGEISAEELNEKTGKLKAMEERLTQQIQQFQKQLDSLK